MHTGYCQMYQEMIAKIIANRLRFSFTGEIFFNQIQDIISYTELED